MTQTLVVSMRTPEACGREGPSVGENGHVGTLAV
jgi:hypothetical protein